MCGVTDISDWCYYESLGTRDYEADRALGQLPAATVAKMTVRPAIRHA